MNRAVRNTFDDIKKTADSYKDTVLLAMKDYRAAQARAKVDSEPYKDAEERYKALCDVAARTARNTIKSAEKEFNSSMTAAVADLRKNLSDHLKAKADPDFWSNLRVYRSFAIVPSRSEIDFLLIDACGNTLALAALDSTLRGMKSPYRIDYKTAEMFDTDLDALEHFARLTKWSPIEYHTEACAIWKDEPKVFQNDRGEFFETGDKISSTSLILSRSAFESSLKQIDGIAESWVNSTIPAVRQVKDYTDSAENGSAAEQYIADREATAESVEVREDNKADEFARKHASERNANAARYTEVMQNYSTKRSSL